MEWKVDKHCTFLGKKCVGDRCIQATTVRDVHRYYDQIQPVRRKVKSRYLLGLITRVVDEKEYSMYRYKDDMNRYRVVKKQETNSLKCTHFGKILASKKGDVIDLQTPTWTNKLYLPISDLDVTLEPETIEPKVVYRIETADPFYVLITIMGLSIILALLYFSITYMPS